MVITMDLALFVAFAALIAALVRNFDAPVTEAAIKPFLIAFASSLVVAVLAVWMLVDANGAVNINFANFVVVAGSAVGGLAFVRALLEAVKPTTKA